MNRLLIVTTLVIFIVPPYAHGQEPNAAILKAKAQKVVSLIGGDKLKTQTYCEIGDLSEQLDQAEEDKDGQKIRDLSQKIGKLEEKLGTEYTALALPTAGSRCSCAGSKHAAPRRSAAALPTGATSNANSGVWQKRNYCGRGATLRKISSLFRWNHLTPTPAAAM
jgi:hypothetical protein